MKILYLVPLLLIFTSCASEKIEVKPDTLPHAVINEPYYQQVSISGGYVHDYMTIDTNMPKDMDIFIEPKDLNSPTRYNELKVYGTPKYKGHYYIYLYGGFYGGGNKRFEKKYDFVISD